MFEEIIVVSSLRIYDKHYINTVQQDEHYTLYSVLFIRHGKCHYKILKSHFDANSICVNEVYVIF